VSGRLAGIANPASGRFAMIEDGLGFQFGPWQPVLEKRLDHYISGVRRDDGGIEWEFGRRAADRLGIVRVSQRPCQHVLMRPDRRQPLKAGASRHRCAASALTGCPGPAAAPHAGKDDWECGSTPMLRKKAVQTTTPS